MCNETASVWEDREALELGGGNSGGTLDRFKPLTCTLKTRLKW